MIVVLGNSFKNLSDKKNIICFNELIEAAEQENVSEFNFVFGQGVTESQVTALKALLENRNKKEKIKFSNYFGDSTRCSTEYTHKHKLNNVLISDPIRNGPQVFESFLMVNDDCAELSDHVTGKHLQYMLLLEAARQMVNAVTEKYYYSSKKIYLADSLSSEFKCFVYPFSVQLIYRVKKKKIKTGGNGKMSIEIDFMQFNKLCVKFSMDFTILDREFVDSVENDFLKSFLSYE